MIFERAQGKTNVAS
jgi:IS30 family transposase